MTRGHGVIWLIVAILDLRLIVLGQGDGHRLVDHAQILEVRGQCAGSRLYDDRADVWVVDRNLEDSATERPPE